MCYLWNSVFVDSQGNQYMHGSFSVKKSLIVLFFIQSTPIFAESLGIHCWQQQPYNHAFCFDVNNTNGRYFSLIGENIIPTEGTYPLQGSALLDDTINQFRLEFTQNLGGTLVYENTATVDVESLNGSWQDDAGNEGDFQYLGVGPLDTEQLQALSTRSKKSPKKTP